MIHAKRYIALLGAALLALTTALMVGPAAELTTAETSVVNDTTFKVSVEQGGSATFNIYVGAFGALKCSATVANPATARVHVSYAVSSGGTVTQQHQLRGDALRRWVPAAGRSQLHYFLGRQTIAIRSTVLGQRRRNHASRVLPSGLQHQPGSRLQPSHHDHKPRWAGRHSD